MRNASKTPFWLLVRLDNGFAVIEQILLHALFLPEALVVPVDEGGLATGGWFQLARWGPAFRDPTTAAVEDELVCVDVPEFGEAPLALDLHVDLAERLVGTDVELRGGPFDCWYWEPCSTILVS